MAEQADFICPASQDNCTWWPDSLSILLSMPVPEPVETSQLILDESGRYTVYAKLSDIVVALQAEASTTKGLQIAAEEVEFFRLLLGASRWPEELTTSGQVGLAALGDSVALAVILGGCNARSCLPPAGLSFSTCHNALL